MANDMQPKPDKVHLKHLELDCAVCSYILHKPTLSDNIAEVTCRRCLKQFFNELKKQRNKLRKV